LRRLVVTANNYTQYKFSYGIDMAMSNTAGLRDRKKEATRQAISDVATRLFVERGFESVSVADIAHEADVSRKTVFNYFARKEDLVFDREEEVRGLVRDAIAGRDGRSPIGAFQILMRTLLDRQHPLFRVADPAAAFWRTVAESPALTTRARELQVTFADDLAAMLSEAVGRPSSDPDARLAASMLMATLVVAYGEALRVFRRRQQPGAAFVTVMERGFAGVDATLIGTPYV